MKLSELGKLQPKTKSILEELNEFVPSESKEDLVESRANHVIKAAINLIEQIKVDYGTEISEDLEKKLINSIRRKDPRKFSRSVQRLKETRNGP